MHYHTKVHSKADQGDDEELTSRSMTRRQQRYANEGDLVSVFQVFIPERLQSRAKSD